MKREQIREIFMAHGFTVKDGQTDLKEYVYDAAQALLDASAPAWEALTPEVLERIEDANREESYWVAVAGECVPTKAYWRPLFGTFYDELDSISLRADAITHIMPFTQPKLPV